MKKQLITLLILVSLEGLSQTLINPNGAVNIYEKESLYFNRKDNFLQLKNAGITFFNEGTSNAQFIETSALTSNYSTTNTNIIQNYTPTIDGQIVYVDVYGIDQNPTLGTRVITNCILEIIDKTNNTIIATSDESLLNTGYPCLPNRPCPPQDYVRFSLSPLPLRLQAGKQYALQLRNTSTQFQAAISCENIYPFGSTNIACQNQTEYADLNFKTVFLGVLELARIDQDGNATFSAVNSATLQVKGVDVKGTKSGFVPIGASNTKCKDVNIFIGEPFTSLNCLVANEPSTDFPDCFAVSLRKYLTDSNTGYQTGAVMRVCRIDDNSWGQNPRIVYNYQPFYP